MFDLNVDAFPENGVVTALDYRYTVSAEGCGASSSSVVNIDDAAGTADAIEDDGHEVAEDLHRPEYVMWQLFPGQGEGCGSKQSFESDFRVGSSETEWLNLSISGSASCHGSTSMANSEQTPPEMRLLQQQVIQKQQVRRSRRGPRSRSSQYRGVTFYRRTGRWESHIWDCGKQVYLGGFDTAHAAARAYDRAAIKFRGLDADINFTLSDYEEDMNQMKNLTKEEFVQVLRRQRTGVSWGSSRYKGLSSPNSGLWETNLGQYPHKAYDKAGTECTGMETVNSFGASNYEMKMPVEANNEGVNHNLDLNLGMSPSVEGQHRTPFGNIYPRQTFPYPSNLGSSGYSHGRQALYGQPLAGTQSAFWSGVSPSGAEAHPGRSMEERRLDGVLPLRRISNLSWKNGSPNQVVPVLSEAASSGFSFPNAAAAAAAAASTSFN